MKNNTQNLPKKGFILYKLTTYQALERSISGKISFKLFAKLFIQIIYIFFHNFEPFSFEKYSIILKYASKIFVFSIYFSPLPLSISLSIAFNIQLKRKPRKGKALKLSDNFIFIECKLALNIKCRFKQQISRESTLKAFYSLLENLIK